MLSLWFLGSLMEERVNIVIIILYIFNWLDITKKKYLKLRESLLKEGGREGGKKSTPSALKGLFINC